MISIIQKAFETSIKNTTKDENFELINKIDVLLNNYDLMYLNYFIVITVSNFFHIVFISTFFLIYICIKKNVKHGDIIELLMLSKFVMKT